MLVRVIKSEGITIGLPNDTSDPRARYGIDQGVYPVKREAVSRGGFAVPWLLLPEPSQPTQFVAGFPETEFRKWAQQGDIEIFEDRWDQLGFLMVFSDPMDQWAAFDQLGLSRPSFTRRQLEQHVIRGSFSLKPSLSTEHRVAVTSADPVSAILRLTPLDQYHVIGEIGLEYKLPKFTFDELSNALG